jgi:hypothetical protein
MRLGIFILIAIAAVVWAVMNFRRPYTMETIALELNYRDNVILNPIRFNPRMSILHRLAIREPSLSF